MLAGISLQHKHAIPLRAPHGGEKIADAIATDGFLSVKNLQTVGQYSQSSWGFRSAYGGSEALLGIAGPGEPPTPGERIEQQPIWDSLGKILELAKKDEIDVAELAAHPELCLCGASHQADGAWLRRIFFSPPKSEVIPPDADQARSATSRLLARVVMSGSFNSIDLAFKHQIGFGNFIESDPLAATLPIAKVWRGLILRNYSVGAWRRAWSWLVDQLSEPRTPEELAAIFAANLPETTVGEFVEALPIHVEQNELLPVEEALRTNQPNPDPVTELKLLFLGALRVHDLEGQSLEAFTGSTQNDDLGPLWFSRKLESNRKQSLQIFATNLTKDLIRRAWRVAYSKMELNADGSIWFPSRIREREGLIFRQSEEGHTDVALRIDSLGWMLAGMGVFTRSNGVWQLTEEGAAIVA